MVSYCTIWYHIVQYGIILYNMVSYCTIWYHIVQYGTILYNMVSYCTIWYHIVQSWIDPWSILDRSLIDPWSIQDRSLIDPWSILDRSLIDPWSIQDSGSPPDKFRLIPWLPYQKEKERFLPWGEHKRLLWPFRGPKGSFKGPRGLPWAPGGSPKSFPWGVKMLQNHYKTCVILRICMFVWKI